MMRIVPVPLTILISVLVLAAPVRADEEGGVVSYGVEADFSTRYLWRGLALSEGPVFQPSAWVSAAGFTLTPWANYVLGNEENQWRFNEVDVYLDYCAEWQGLEVTPCLGLYLYPNQPDVPTTADLTLELAYPVGPLGVFTGHTVDLMASPGAYFGEAGVSAEHEFMSELSLEAEVSAGWASAKFNEEFAGVSSHSALNLLAGELSLTWSPGGFLYLRPHAGLNLFIDNELREAQGTTTFAAGIAVGKEF